MADQPDAAPAADAQPTPEGPQGAPQQGPVMQLIQSIHTQMQQLEQAIEGMGAISSDVKSGFSSLIEDFEELVQEAVSGGQGPQPGNVPPEAGGAKVQPAM